MNVIFDLYSKRQARARGETSDLLDYDTVPNKLRVQIVQIVREAFGTPTFHPANEAAKGYAFIASVLKKEYGQFSLVKTPRNDADDVQGVILGELDVDRVLDCIELLFRYIDVVIRKDLYYGRRVNDVVTSPSESLAELNIRFRENGFGYSFASGEIIRVDSVVLHNEAVLPALRLLSEKGFEGPNSDFLEAHAHYRKGDFDDAVVNAAKAFESTLKTICDLRTWQYDKNATAKPLINVVLTNGLIPTYFDSVLANLRGLLENTVLVRNKEAGHGAGAVSKELPEWFARYALNVTASAIVFLVEAHNNAPIVQAKS